MAANRCSAESSIRRRQDYLRLRVAPLALSEGRCFTSYPARHSRHCVGATHAERGDAAMRLRVMLAARTGAPPNPL